jgi:N-acetylneuraminate lyase
MSIRLTGLIPAVFTPMHDDGRLNLDQVGPLVERLIKEDVSGLYVCGSTGEGPSLSSAERRATLEAFIEAAAGRLPVIAQVGHNSLAEARDLAAHAQRTGANAISATPPSYFKPLPLEALVHGLVEIAAGAPELPFYYYHIPSATGVNVDLAELLRRGSDRLPSLVGAKYSATAIYELQACVNLDGGRFNMLFGTDEMLLSALCIGVDGAVGSTYNFAAPLYHRVTRAFEQGDLTEARACQGLAAQMVRVILRHGALPALKAVMALIGLDCGPTRLPLMPLQPEQTAILKRELEELGFFDWRVNNLF